MSLISRVRDFLSGKHDEPSRLRNKPGGRALVRATDGDWRTIGASQIDGYIVTTVRLEAGGQWACQPKPIFTAMFDFECHGIYVKRGDDVVCLSICDEWLEPLPEVGVTDSEVRELYEPQRETA